jgi:hypothetical protein
LERITPRYIFEARIRISAQRGSEDLAMEGWARDISESGLSAFVARGLMVEEMVTLEIPLVSLRTLRIPARVARCMGTQYGFQFTALSPDQRTAIRSAIKDLPECAVSDQEAGSTLRKRHSEPETGLPSSEQAKRQNIDTSLENRARMLIKRGYTPKVAVELVLHELEVEQGSNSRIMDQARSEAEDFLAKLRRGVI